MDLMHLTIVTEWKAFRNPDFSRLKNALKRQLSLMGATFFSPKDMGQYWD